MDTEVRTHIPLAEEIFLPPPVCWRWRRLRHGPLPRWPAMRPRSRVKSHVAPGTLRKIPIGVFDPAFPNLSTDEMIDKFAAWGVEAVEIGTGGYPNSTHCPVKDLLDDPGKAKRLEEEI